MKLKSALLRKYYFARYTLTPFRFSMVTRTLAKRLSSRLGFRQGFRIIDLGITYKCNFNCEHCSAMIMEKNAPTLTLDDYRGIVRQAKDLDVLSWNITGGEPLQVEWLDELIPILEPRTHYISIQTNCFLLDRKRAEELAALGVNCITTSLDSSVPEEHDSFRGQENSYRKVLEAAGIARRAGMHVLIGATVTHQNLRSRGLIDLINIINKAGAICLFNLAIPCGNWKNNTEIILRGDDREYLKELLETYPMTSTDHEPGRNAIGCPAGTEKVYITAYGDVIPCPFIHVSFGNVRETPLFDIVKKMQQIPEFSEYQKICLAAEDIDFQQKVLKKIYSLNCQCPVPSELVYE